MGNRQGNKRKATPADGVKEAKKPSEEAAQSEATNTAAAAACDVPEVKKRKKKEKKTERGADTELNNAPAGDVVVPEVKKRKKKEKKKFNKSNTARNEIKSCPAEMMAVAADEEEPTTKLEPPEAEPERKFEVKIYRSYSNCTAADRNALLAPAEPSLDDVKIYRRSKDRLHEGCSGTLSRSFNAGRSKSPASRDYPELGRRALRWESLSDTRSSIRASTTSSLTSVCYKGEVIVIYASTKRIGMELLLLS